MKEKVVQHFIDDYNTLHPDAYMVEITRRKCECCEKYEIEEIIRLGYK